MPPEIKELDYENLRDLKRVAELFSQELEPQGDVQWWNKEALGWGGQTTTHNLKVFVAKRNGQVVAAAVGLIDSPKNNPREINAKLGKGKHYCFGGTAVSPQFRRMGISTALTEKMLTHALSLGCRTVYGATVKTNLAQKRQFERDGYELFHRQIREDFGEVHWYKKRL